MSIFKVLTGAFAALGMSTFVMPASAAADDYVPSAASAEDVRAANRELIALRDQMQSKCIQHDGRLQYIGATNIQLVDCLLHRAPETQLLTISSAGGEVEFAIWAASILHGAEMNLHVLGSCASSCANYLVPAADRVYIDRISTIMVHGAPQPTVRAEVEEMLKSYGTKPSDPDFDGTVDLNLSRLNATVRLHQWFVTQHDIGPGYSDVGNIDTVSPDALLVVDPEVFRDCGPHIESLVSQDRYKEDLRRAYGDKPLVFLSEVPEYAPCE